MLPLRIAWRYLKSKKTHNAVNIISIVATLGVVVTTAALIIVLSVFNGFKGMVEERLSQLDPDLMVTPASGKVMANGDSVADAVKDVPGVKTAFAAIEDQALAIYADYQMPVRLLGVPDNYARFNGMDNVIVNGGGQSVLNDEVASYALVSAGPAVQLHVQPNSPRMLQLYAPMRQGRVNIANPVDAFTADSLFVGAVFQVQQNDVDADLIVVPVDFARNLFDYPDEASQIQVFLNPGTDTERTRVEIARRLGKNFEVKDRLMQQAESYRLINIEKWMTFLLLAFIMLIATFNVISTLALLVVEKRESVATLRSLGASQQFVRRVFVAQAWLITAVGAIIGLVVGILLSLGQQYFGWVTLAGDTSRLIVQAYPVRVVWTDVVVVLALVAVIALVTSAITAAIARRSISTSPAPTA